MCCAGMSDAGIKQMYKQSPAACLHTHTEKCISTHWSLRYPLFHDKLVDMPTPSRKRQCWDTFTVCEGEWTGHKHIVFFHPCSCVCVCLCFHLSAPACFYVSVSRHPGLHQAVWTLINPWRLSSGFTSGYGVIDWGHSPHTYHVARSTAFTSNICAHGQKSAMYKYRLTKGIAASGLALVSLALEVKCVSISLR